MVIQSAESDENEADKPQLKPRKTVPGALHSIWEKEGILGFYKGLQAQILKTVLSSALLLMIKEKITKSTWFALIALRRFILVTRSRLKSSWTRLSCIQQSDFLLEFLVELNSTFFYFYLFSFSWISCRFERFLLFPVLWISLLLCVLNYHILLLQYFCHIFLLVNIEQWKWKHRKMKG